MNNGSGVRPKIIYIYGPDGSGKSTLCRELESLLRNRGIPTAYRWMRFSHYSSRGVNAVGRLAGLSFHKTYQDGTRIGYHQYYKSKLFSFVYCASTVVDMVLASFMKIWLPLWMSKHTVILDRYVFDTLVDLSVDTRDQDLSQRWPGRMLKRLLTPAFQPVFLNVNRELVLQRRPDALMDENFGMRLDLYKKIHRSHEKSLEVLNTSDIRSALERIEEAIGL